MFSQHIEDGRQVEHPDNSTEMGRELRLKQQYFFVCATLQDIRYRYSKYHKTFDVLPDKVAIQLNDTHPSIAVAELMRVLVDQHHIDWDRAWDITTRTFAYTDHTLMPEALESWPVALFAKLLPRHLQIIYEINHRLLKDARHRFPGNTELLRRMSIIDEQGEKSVRMAHLAIVGSHSVNGVAAIHTELMKKTIFAGFDHFFPGRIINITNGITPRRWLNQANPRLAALISSRIGRGWVRDSSELKQLIPYAEDAQFCAEFAQVKRANKAAFADMLDRKLCLTVGVDAMFDVQIKRIHEYKRHLLNVLHVVTLYNRICSDRAYEGVPRVVVFSGRAAVFSRRRTGAASSRSSPVRGRFPATARFRSTPNASGTPNRYRADLPGAVA